MWDLTLTFNFSLFELNNSGFVCLPLWFETCLVLRKEGRVVMLQFFAITKLQKLSTLGSNSEQIRHSFTSVTYYNFKRYLFYVFVFFYFFLFM